MDVNKLISGYEKMMEHFLDFVSKAENTAEQHLEIAFNSAKEKLKEIKDYTDEEINQIEKYVSRDLKHAGKKAKESQKELREWFKFDISLIESRIWEKIVEIADPTWLKLNQLKEQSFQFKYKTGQLTGPSSLKCKECGKEHHFYKVSHIPPCSQCKKTEFERIE